MAVENPNDLGGLAAQLRVDAVRAAAAAGSGHPTSSLSAADLMAVLLARHLRYDVRDPAAPGISVEVADVDADELVVTDTMRQRKQVMEDRADAFVVLPGGIGTLEELFEMWTARVLGVHDRPLVILDPWGLYGPLRELVNGMYEAGFTRADVFDAISWTTTIDEAFRHLEARAQPVRPSVEELSEAAD